MSYNEYYQILQAGLLRDPKAAYRFSEHGYNIQEDGIYMTRKRWGKDRDRAERFARASRKGWEWAVAHPKETLEIVMQYIQANRIATNRTLQRLMLEETLRLQLDPDSGEREFRLRPDMVRQASGMMHKAGLLGREIGYEELVP
jgi:NitT/TauT family transport system substrate-binding protein